MNSQPKWDIYESVVLLNGYLLACKKSEPRAYIIRRVSADLRAMAIHRGRKIDEIFRNENGISYQMQSMDSAYKGRKIYVPATKLFQETVSLYKNQNSRFQWAYETEELALRVDYYAMNQNLYVELYSKEDGAWEPFSDLTVNLPGYCLEPGTACISGDFSKENIQFIQEHGLGTLLPWKAQSGMGQYAVVKFHLEELRKFDQAGVAAFCNQHGLQKTMQEERRQSR